MALLLAMALLVGDTAPTAQTLVYYNARMALREGRPAEAVKLWLLRNTLASEDGRVSAHDADFRSVTWAALGELGICLDGFPKDERGVGLWPLATHNWVVKNMYRPTPFVGASPFEAFAIGRQQRAISIHDVLDAAELRALRLRSGACIGVKPTLFALDQGWSAPLRDKQVAARILRHLLHQALGTLDASTTRGQAVLEARIFDLNLQLAGLGRKAKSRALRTEQREGRWTGLSRAELVEHGDSDPGIAFAPDSEEAEILRTSLTWSADQWMALSSARRQYLFGHAAPMATDPERLGMLELGIIDRLIETRQGAELQSWIARHSYGGDEVARRLIWHGERGRRILSLDRETGFRERAPIALRRGVDFLASGQQPEALRALAHALRWAENSTKGEETRNLSRRWLSFVAAQFRLTDELLAMLRSVVPRGDFAAVLEDQLWHAALNADQSSFQLCLKHQTGRGALHNRAMLLRPLAQGNSGTFLTQIEGSLAESPYFAMRFIRQMLQRLQVQSLEVRGRYGPMLSTIKDLLEVSLAEAEQSKARLKRSTDAMAQIRSMLEGIDGGLPNPNTQDKADGLSPHREVYIGSFRVAPSDPLPWPFAVAEMDPPRVFAPLTLRPEEWRDPSGELVFGWRVSD